MNADEDSMDGVGAERADEAWVPMDFTEGQVCAAVPMGCEQAWAHMGCEQAWAPMAGGLAWVTKGWVLEVSAGGPMGRALEVSTAEAMDCGQAWAPMAGGLVCAVEASAHPKG